MGNYVTGKYTTYLAFMYLNKQLSSNCCQCAKGNNAQTEFTYHLFNEINELKSTCCRLVNYIDKIMEEIKQNVSL